MRAIVFFKLAETRDFHVGYQYVNVLAGRVRTDTELNEQHEPGAHNDRPCFKAAVWWRIEWLRSVPGLRQRLLLADSTNARQMPCENRERLSVLLSLNLWRLIDRGDVQFVGDIVCRSRSNNCLCRRLPRVLRRRVGEGPHIAAAY